MLAAFKLLREFSSKNGDFKVLSAKLLAKFQAEAKEALSSGSNLSLLEGLKVKLSTDKGTVPLTKLCTLNLIDAQRVELSALDQSVNIAKKCL